MSAEFFAHLGRDIQNIILSYLDQTDLVHLLRINKVWHQSPILNSKIQLLKEWSEERADYFHFENIANNTCLIYKNGELINKYSTHIDEENLKVIKLFVKDDNFYRISFEEGESFLCYGFDKKVNSSLYTLGLECLNFVWDFRKNILYWHLRKFQIETFPLICFKSKLFSRFDFQTTRGNHIIDAKFQYRFFEPRFGMFLTYYFKASREILGRARLYSDNIQHLIRYNNHSAWIVESIKNPFSINLR